MFNVKNALGLLAVLLFLFPQTVNAKRVKKAQLAGYGFATTSEFVKDLKRCKMTIKTSVIWHNRTNIPNKKIKGLGGYASNMTEKSCKNAVGQIWVFEKYSYNTVITGLGGMERIQKKYR